MPKNLNKIIKLKVESEVIIKKAHLSTRCEICHQIDYFDPISNYCSRCTNIAEQLENHKIVQYDFSNGISEGAIMSGLISFIFMLLMSPVIIFPDTSISILLWALIYSIYTTSEGRIQTSW